MSKTRRNKMILEANAISSNVRPVCDEETKGLKLLVLKTESFVSTFGFAANSTAVLRLFGIYRLLCFGSPDGQIQGSNVRANSQYKGI